MQRDLFSEDRGGWITDAALLERLVAERMEREAEAIRAEGWRWVAIGQEAQSAGMEHAAGSGRARWPCRRRTKHGADELASRYDELAEEHNGSAEDLPDDVAAELDRIESRACGSGRQTGGVPGSPRTWAGRAWSLTLAADGSHCGLSAAMCGRRTRHSPSRSHAGRGRHRGERHR